jgi:hypothetical protein
MKQNKVFRKLLALIIALACGLLIPPGAFAASSAILDVSADIPTSSPQISVTILKFTDGNPDNNPWTNSEVIDSGVLDFGELTYLLTDGSNAGLFYSPAGYCVVLFAQSFGKPYDIWSSCSGISNSGGVFLNSGSFGLTPAYSPKDKWVYPGNPQGSEQGDLPGFGATPGPAGSAVGDKLIYTSESNVGTARILQAYYGLPPYATGGADPFPGYVPIPLTQAPGKYTGQVTITISLK